MKPMSTTERSFFDERVGTHFINAVKQTVLAFFGEEPRMHEVKITNNIDSGFQLAAAMPFHSHEVEASMVIATRAPFALALYENMIGEKLEALTPDVDDCIAELSNMVYGMAKAPLVNEGFEFPMSRPTTTRDPASVLKNQKCLVLIFRAGTDEGREFALILAVHRLDAKANPAA